MNKLVQFQDVPANEHFSAQGHTFKKEDHVSPFDPLCCTWNATRDDGVAFGFTPAYPVTIAKGETE